MAISPEHAETSSNNNEIARDELSITRDDSTAAYTWRPEMLDVQRRNAHLTLPEPPAPMRYFLHVMAPALYDEVAL